MVFFDSGLSIKMFYFFTKILSFKVADLEKRNLLSFKHIFYM